MVRATCGQGMEVIIWEQGFPLIGDKGPVNPFKCRVCALITLCE
jgi:hypothetical protein